MKVLKIIVIGCLLLLPGCGFYLHRKMTRLTPVLGPTEAPVMAQSVGGRLVEALRLIPMTDKAREEAVRLHGQMGVPFVFETTTEWFVLELEKRNEDGGEDRVRSAP